MNSIEFLNQLVQSINSLNSVVFTLRNDIETIKKDMSNIKDSISGLHKERSIDENNHTNDEQVQTILCDMNNTKVMIDEMQNKLLLFEKMCKNLSFDGDFDYYKTISRETSEKLKNLEIAFTLKMNTLERYIKNIPKSVTKDEVQNMIDQSFPNALKDCHPISSTLDTLKCNQDQFLTIPVQEISDRIETNEIDIETSKEYEIEKPVDVVIESIETVSDTKAKKKKSSKKK